MSLLQRWRQSRPEYSPLAIRMIVMLIAVGVVFGAIFGFQVFKARMAQRFLAANQAQPVVVAAAPAGFETWRPGVDAVGSLRAVRGIEVTTEVAGMVSAVNFESGEFVEAGELLVQLTADADIAELQAARVAAELAGTAFRRAKEQFAVQAISRAALDAAAADLKSRRAGVARQEALVAKKTIRAPFAGRLGISNVSLGQYINPGESIVTLQTIDPIRVDFNVPQQQLAQLAVGQSVTVTSNVFPDRQFAGTVNAIDPRIDPNTRNVQAQATLGNTKYELLPGMFATVAVQTGEAQRRLTLPRAAITYNPYGSTVFGLEETPDKSAQGQPIYTARQRFVETGETSGDEVAIVSGVKEGELVVVAGQLKLRSGAPAVIGEETRVSLREEK